MSQLFLTLGILASFLIIALSSNQIARVFQKFKLPHITGLLLIGIISGPFVLKIIGKNEINNIYFINEISLAYIAFAAGAELYLKELRSRYKSIGWMTFGQVSAIFILSTLCIYFLSVHIPFMKEYSYENRLLIALLASTIFVGRSPASAIAVISEMRAKGPFTQTVIGVTIIKDVLVIILFTIVFSLSITILEDENLNFIVVLKVFIELLISIGLGYLLGIIISFILSTRLFFYGKLCLVLIAGYSVYFLENNISHILLEFNFHFHIEPILSCIVASFYVTNFSKFKMDFHRIIHEAAIPVYVAFFTLTGASVSIDILIQNWHIALLFFIIRLITMTTGTFLGGKLGGDPVQLYKHSWMAYITQAGVALGLISIISKKIPTWGNELATTLIAVVVINLVIGPPLFKWVLNFVGESHKRAIPQDYKDERNAVIFGLESQSIALAQKLIKHNWRVKVLTQRQEIEEFDIEGINICHINEVSLEEFNRLKVKRADAIVALNTDEENFKICEIAFENYGTKDLIVRVHDHRNIPKFQELNARIVEPSTAMVGLMDHFVRSPIATSMILGLDEQQDTIDIEVLNHDFQGLALRELQLPIDLLILSIKRGDSQVISHGYTRLRVGDIITVVGSNESLENLRLRMETSQLIMPQKKST